MVRLPARQAQGGGKAEEEVEVRSAKTRSVVQAAGGRGCRLVLGRYMCHVGR